MPQPEPLCKCGHSHDDHCIMCGHCDHKFAGSPDTPIYCHCRDFEAKTDL